MSLKNQVLNRVADHLPGNMRSIGRSLYYRGRHPVHSSMKGFGTVQDLYYWVADGEMDTVLLLQNYFSAMYPNLNTKTEGKVTIYSDTGAQLGEESFSLPHLGSAKFRVSALRERMQIPAETTFGTLEVHISIPADVLAHVQDQKHLYFWDRFYIGYTNGQGQICFVHGVDKTDIYSENKSKPDYWYPTPENRQWTPEIPVDIRDYKRFSVIMINRTERSSKMMLTVTDSEDISRSWTAEVPSRGVHRFELTPSDLADMVPKDMRMRVDGMASRYGRPTVFKEFHNGAISAMHC